MHVENIKIEFIARAKNKINNNLILVLRKPADCICEQQGVDQPAPPRSLTSTSVVCCLDSISTKALQRLRKPC